jgi:hypothetical protein
MIEARRGICLRQPPHPVLRRTGDHDPVGDFGRRGFERALNIAGSKRFVNRRHPFNLDPMALEERRGHQRDIERGEDSPGAARDVAIRCDRAEEAVTPVQAIRDSAGALRPGLKVLHREAQSLR